MTRKSRHITAAIDTKHLVEEGAKQALTSLVRLLAQQAVGEVFADAKEAVASPASPPTKMESDDG